MILLDTNTKLEIVLESSPGTELNFLSTYIDTIDDTPGHNDGITNSTTDVIITAAPSSGTRLIRYIHVYNPDSSARSVIIKIDDGVNERIIVKKNLEPTKALTFNSEAGWNINQGPVGPEGPEGPEGTGLVQSQQELTDGTNISWDIDNGEYAYVTLGGDRTLDNPTNVKVGGLYRLRVTQDGTGSRTLSFGSNYKFPGGVEPTLSGGANDVDLLEFIAHDSSTLYLVNALFDIS